MTLTDSAIFALAISLVYKYYLERRYYNEHTRKHETDNLSSRETYCSGRCFQHHSASSVHQSQHSGQYSKDIEAYT